MSVLHRLSFTGVALALLTCAGCDASGSASEGEGEGEGEGEDPVTVDELVSAQVSYYSRCWAELFGYNRAFVDAAEPEFAARIEGLVADAELARSSLERTLANGSTISEENAPGCVAALLASTCTPLPELEAACRAALTGTRADGGTCAEDINCSGALACQLPAVPSAVCGTCTTRAAVGDSCAAAACTDEAYCAQTETTATCVVRPPRDAPCPDGVCADGLLCGADSTCVTAVVSSPPAEGDPCEANLDCGFLSGLACSVQSATCAPAEVADLGDDCNPAVGVLWCQDQYSNHRCIDQDFDGLGTCNPLSAVGESCSAIPCALGLNCVDETCASAPLPGEPCNDDAGNFCAVGSCVDRECVSPEAAVCPL